MPSETNVPENPLRRGLSPRKAPSPAALVLFGASGDLTRRKLLPALFHLARNGYLPPKLAVVGAARRQKTDGSFREEALAAIRARWPDVAADDPDWRTFAECLFYEPVNFDDPGGYSRLAARLAAIERSLGLPGNRLYYLSTAPEHFATVVRGLSRENLVAEKPGAGRWSRVIVEKPFGHDLESAAALNRELLQFLKEDQIYRIDHYLGKETVQNLLAFRFANEIFEPIWNHKYVSHVQITAAETVGVEGRGGYYDRSGVVRDMVQNHLLQVLALVAMEPPVVFEADAIRNEKVKVLQAVRRVVPAAVPERVVLAQYGPGKILGRDVPGYREEEGVPRDSRTPTYAALRLEVDAWRWAGTPFFLRSGKRLARRATEICIQFRRPPLRLFAGDGAYQAAPNALIVNIQPDEGISLRFGAKLPGADIRIQQVKMDFRYGTSFGTPAPEAYERLLLDALSGDATLFTRKDEVEAAWRIVTGVLEAWEASDERPLEYAAGSWGPVEAEHLFRGIDGSWRRI